MIKLEGGRVIDPGYCDDIRDIYIKNGVIVEEDDNFKDEKIRILDARNLIVAPGFIDLHVHLRDPGFEYKETIQSGTSAAAKGGFTAVCCMPNTDPVNDNSKITAYIQNKAKKAGASKVYPVGAVSYDLLGKEITDFNEMIQNGAVAFTDDGMPVHDSQLMRRALEAAKKLNTFIMAHCEESALAAGGSANECTFTKKMGLSGIPNVSESIMVNRDIELCELAGSRLHICHVSTKESVRHIRNAKKRGVRVTAETAPHYFTLTTEAIKGYNTNAKMNPPLRSKEDRLAILEGLKDGTLDAIATDHAPHAAHEKKVSFNDAPNGIIGLETSLPLSLKLVRDNILSMSELIEKMAKNPSAILGKGCSLRPGSIADITVFDPNKKCVADSGFFKSKSQNTPFTGWELTGQASFTIVNGNIVYES